VGAALLVEPVEVPAPSAPGAGERPQGVANLGDPLSARRHETAEGWARRIQRRERRHGYLPVAEYVKRMASIGDAAPPVPSLGQAGLGLVVVPPELRDLYDVLELRDDPPAAPQPAPATGGPRATAEPAGGRFVVDLDASVAAALARGVSDLQLLRERRAAEVQACAD
jgi:hypothetical protein